MKSIPLLALAATAALLPGCHKPATAPAADNGADTNLAEPANSTAAAAPAALPPAIAKTTSYRCKAAGVISVDFMDDHKTALLHATPDGTPVSLTAADAGKPFEGSGYTLSGDGSTVSYTAPGKDKDSCQS